MSESQSLICAATGCSNAVRRSGDRADEPMVARVLFTTGLEVRVGTCEEHTLPRVGVTGMVVGFDLGTGS